MQFLILSLSGMIEAMSEFCLVILKQKEKGPRNKKRKDVLSTMKNPVSHFLKRCPEILKILTF